MGHFVYYKKIPDDWLFQSNLYFIMNEVTDHKKMPPIIMSFKGDVLVWSY